MSKNLIIFVVLTILLCCSSQSKSQGFAQFNAEVKVNGTALKYPFAGGFNNPQMNEIDLNRDGKMDLVIFDRSGSVLIPFLYNGTDYVFSPEYAAYFPPELNSYVLLRDYNGDGLMDIFSSIYDNGVIGMAVYKGKWINGHIGFDRINFYNYQANVINYIQYNGFRANLNVLPSDIPCVSDIDGDGDLDILTFEFGAGNASYFKNLSVERGFGKDSLIYDLTDDCWGKFFDSGYSLSVRLGSTDSCARSFTGGGGVISRHAGSCLTVFDKDGDGDKDALFSSISFNGMNLLTNGGNRTAAVMTAQDPRFPSNDTSVSIPIFPAAFFVDVDHDGKKDLFVAPNGVTFCENKQVGWYYKNIGTSSIANFHLQQKDFLVGDMLDLGWGAFPTFSDIDGDGLQDLIIGNNSLYSATGQSVSKLAYYRNAGTNTQPKFTLIDSDWLSLSRFSSDTLTNFAPTFGDIDGDGDHDLLLGTSNGSLIFIPNIGTGMHPFSAGTAQANYQGINQYSYPTPQIFDLNKDGLPDIITGSRLGYIIYYQNIGTRVNPQFSSSPTNTQLGGVDVRGPNEYVGYTTPQFIDFNGRTVLFTGSLTGKLFLYDSISGNINGNFRQVDKKYGSIKIGDRTAPAFKDLDGDGIFELFVGNFRGGVGAFISNLRTNGTRVGTNDLVNIQHEVNIFPNPASNLLYINAQNFVIKSVQVFSVTGSKLDIEKSINNNIDSIDTSHLISGMYFMKIIFEDDTFMIKKFFKK
jgi:hypothetical protein